MKMHLSFIARFHLRCCTHTPLRPPRALIRCSPKWRGGTVEGEGTRVKRHPRNFTRARWPDTGREHEETHAEVSDGRLRQRRPDEQSGGSKRAAIKTEPNQLSNWVKAADTTLKRLQTTKQSDVTELNFLTDDSRSRGVFAVVCSLRKKQRRRTQVLSESAAVYFLPGLKSK